MKLISKYLIAFKNRFLLKEYALIDGKRERVLSSLGDHHH